MPITHKQARESAQRLIDARFGNIIVGDAPTIIARYIDQQEAEIAALHAEIEARKREACAKIADLTAKKHTTRREKIEAFIHARQAETATAIAAAILNQSPPMPRVHTLLARIEADRAMIAELQDERDDLRDRCEHYQAHMHDAGRLLADTGRERDALRAELAEAKQVIEPFAHTEDDMSSDALWLSFEKITDGDLRAAHAWLAKHVDA